MSTTINALLLVLATLLPYSGQDQVAFYVESWKKGTRQVQERTIDIHLSKASPEYETLIKDDAGRDRYRLSLWPGRVSENNTSIIEWMVELVDITNESEGNLLNRSNDEQQDYFSAEDRVGWLYPLKNPKSINAQSDMVPIFAKRIVKIENFYLAIEVKDFQFSNTKKALSSMTVQVEFTNSRKDALKQKTQVVKDVNVKVSP